MYNAGFTRIFILRFFAAPYKTLEDHCKVFEDLLKILEDPSNIFPMVVGTHSNKQQAYIKTIFRNMHQVLPPLFERNQWGTLG